MSRHQRTGVMLGPSQADSRGLEAHRGGRPPWPSVIAGLYLLGTAFPAGVAWASFSSQTINTSNKFSSGTVQLKIQTSGSVNCFSTGTGSGATVSANNTPCPDTPLPTGELTTSSVLSATSTLKTVGTVTPTQGVYSLVSCGEAEAADSSSSANTGLVYSGVTYGTTFTSPVNSGFTSKGVALSGAAGTYVGTTKSLASPSTFTIVTWVKTSSTVGGGFIGFSNVQPDTGSSNQDRMLWVEPSGVVAFGVQNGSTLAELASTLKVNNGAWHFVAASFSSAGLSLNIDGTTVTSTTITSATSYTGYWHLGWAGDSAWTNPGTDQYLNGSLYGMAIFGTVVSSANLAALENETTLTAYTAKITSLSPSAEWLLSDSGTVAYTGTVPVLGTNQICQRVLVDIQQTQNSITTCIYPAGAGACASTPTSGDLLSSFTTSSEALSSPAAITILYRVVLGTASVAGVTGLHLLPDFAFTISDNAFTAELTYPSSNLEM